MEEKERSDLLKTSFINFDIKENTKESSEIRKYILREDDGLLTSLKG